MKREIIMTPAAPARRDPMEMLATALEGGAEPSIVEKMMDMAERWNAMQARQAFDAAMADAKARLPIIRKNRRVNFESKRTNTRTDYTHEDLAEIVKTIDPVLTEYGLSYRWRTTQEGARVTVTCIVAHRDGHSEENSLSASPDDSGNKNSIQQVGSTITYLQRYTLKAALGLAASEDDDAQAAGGVDRINADQYRELVNLIDKAGADEGAVRSYANVEAFEDLTVSGWSRVIALLEQKVAKNAS